VSTALHTYCDAAAARCTRVLPTADHPRLVLATTILASSLAFVDGSVVNVALPAIGQSLTAGPAALQWCINAYLLPLSATLLLGGAAGDRFGRRRVLVAGVALFALASLGCAFAPTLTVLLVARFCQGIAAAALTPASLAILGETFSGEAKGRAIGIWAATSAIAGAVGPVLGGWLIDLGSWRAIFLINLPLAFAAIVLALRYVPDDRPARDHALDVRGGLLATAALGAITWALTVAAGSSGWTPAAIVAGLAGGVLMILFVMIERWLGDQALTPLHLFASRILIGLNALTFLLYGALGALLILVPYVLIEAQGYSAKAAGAALLPLPIILTVSSPLTGALAGRTGSRLPIALGALVVAAGLLLCLRVQMNSSYWTGLLPAILLVSVGLSAAVAPLTTEVLSSVDARYTGAASGLNSAIARTGSLIATALLGAVLASRGEWLLTAFHAAMAVSALACVGAALTALTLLKR
jgi:EmrB/QacA subfamily drug resistance transporter